MLIIYFVIYDGYNILHQYSVSNKEVSKIVVNHSQRGIKLTYSQKIIYGMSSILEIEDL